MPSIMETWASKAKKLVKPLGKGKRHRADLDPVQDLVSPTPTATNDSPSLQAAVPDATSNTGSGTVSKAAAVLDAAIPSAAQQAAAGGTVKDVPLTPIINGVPVTLLYSNGANSGNISTNPATSASAATTAGPFSAAADTSVLPAAVPPSPTSTVVYDSTSSSPGSSPDKVMDAVKVAMAAAHMPDVSAALQAALATPAVVTAQNGAGPAATTVLGLPVQPPASPIAKVKAVDGVAHVVAAPAAAAPAGAAGLLPAPLSKTAAGEALLSGPSPAVNPKLMASPGSDPDLVAVVAAPSAKGQYGIFAVAKNGVAFMSPPAILNQHYPAHVILLGLLFLPVAVWVKLLMVSAQTTYKVASSLVPWRSTKSG